MQPVIDSPGRYGFMPGAPWSGYQMPGASSSGYQMPSQLETLPWVYRSLMHDAALALGIRWDSCYSYFDAPQVEHSTQVVVTVPPSKPPTIDVGTNPRPPYRPPGSRPDRKVRMGSWKAFQVVQAAFHG